MDNFIENKKIALFVVSLVSKMYHLDDADVVVPAVIKDKVAERTNEISKRIELDK